MDTTQSLDPEGQSIILRFCGRMIGIGTLAWIAAAFTMFCRFFKAQVGGGGYGKHRHIDGSAHNALTSLHTLFSRTYTTTVASPATTLPHETAI